MAITQSRMLALLSAALDLSDAAALTRDIAMRVRDGQLDPTEGMEMIDSALTIPAETQALLIVEQKLSALTKRRNDVRRELRAQDASPKTGQARHHAERQTRTGEGKFAAPDPSMSFAAQDRAAMRAERAKALQPSPPPDYQGISAEEAEEAVRRFGGSGASQTRQTPGLAFARAQGLETLTDEDLAATLAAPDFSPDDLG